MTASLETCANCQTALTPVEWRGQPRLECTGCAYCWTTESLELAWQNRVEPPPEARLSLTFEPNGTEHCDLVLRVGEWVRRCDTYYFALDHPVGAVVDVAAAGRALLLLWKALVGSVSESHPCFLAFEFSDQQTGWVRCLRRGSEIELRPGWSGVEGWRIYPSDCLEESTKLDDFAPAKDAPGLRVDRAQLLGDIERSLAALPERPRLGGPHEAMRRRRIGRLEDLARRATYKPGDGVQVPGLGLYVAVHPMADERELLASLDMRPADCRSVDAYVAMSADVHFVQVRSRSSDIERAPGLYGRSMEGTDRADGYRLHLVAVLECEFVDRAQFEGALRALRAALAQAYPPDGDTLAPLT